MMKKIVLYESKHGCTEMCANFIKEKNNDLKISQISKFQGDINDYDHIIIGTPVYVGQIHKKVKKFIETNKALLLHKKISIFVCAMNMETYDQMLQSNFDEAIRNHADIIHAGGAYDFEQLGRLSKFVVKKIAKVSHSTSDIKYDRLMSL